MTELVTPTAGRLRRPSWRERRLLLGLLLVVVATVLGARAVAGAGDRVPVWVAADNLLAGDAVGSGSFVRADVRLAEGLASYLGADAPPPVGSFLLRDVRAGELVPTSAVGAADAVGVQRVTVRADAMATTGLVRGSRVDVFVTPRASTTAERSAPATTKVLSSAGVAAVLTTSGGFGAGSLTSVQIYVPSEKVQALVEAVDGEARLTLVPAVGAATGGAG